MKIDKLFSRYKEIISDLKVKNKSFIEDKEKDHDKLHDMNAEIIQLKKSRKEILEKLEINKTKYQKQIDYLLSRLKKHYTASGFRNVKKGMEDLK